MHEILGSSQSEQYDDPVSGSREQNPAKPLLDPQAAEAWLLANGLAHYKADGRLAPIIPPDENPKLLVIAALSIAQSGQPQNIGNVAANLTDNKVIWTPKSTESITAEINAFTPE